MKTRRNPAVTAGLVGAAILVPQPALAASLAEAVSSVLGSPVACFGAGVLTGAVVSGVVSAVVCHSLMARDQRLRCRVPCPGLPAHPVEGGL